MWLQQIAGSASILHYTYAITAHSLRVQLINNALDHDAFSAELIKSNVTLHLELHIVKVSYQPMRYIRVLA